MLEVDPIARRHAQEIGGAPDYVILELADLAVGIDQLPHHFDDAKPALLIHRAHDDAGEMIEIDRLTLPASQTRSTDLPCRDRARNASRADCEVCVFQSRTARRRARSREPARPLPPDDIRYRQRPDPGVPWETRCRR